MFNHFMKNTDTKKVNNVEGMGSVIHKNGVLFRLWAPHANQIFVTGDFCDWNKEAVEMISIANGYWETNVENAKAGQSYKYILHTEKGILEKNDPYAKQLTHSSGNSIIIDTNFDWTDEKFQMPPWNELVIYELHIGTFNRIQKDKPGDFSGVKEKLQYLKSLGINAIEIMPPTEFPGELSWGYNPSSPFAIESSYGGAAEIKDLINSAHSAGIAVILDIVYNHFGPGDLDLWQFDGWNENGDGGIYFYQNYKAETAWGRNRPDYGRPEVRQYIRDNALMWLEEYHVDGLRTDAIAFITNVYGHSDVKYDILEGWTLTKWINEEVKKRFPWKIMIAEDLRNNEWLTKSEGAGGQGFSAQWDPGFVHPVRNVLSAFTDQNRNMNELAEAISKKFNGDAFQRVIYTDSHDDVANGNVRLPEMISPSEGHNWFAKKRSIIGAALVFTSVGIPMIFQGQEILEAGWFSDDKPLDWTKFNEFKGITKLYQDLIGLRKNSKGISRGLCGQQMKIAHINNNDKVIAYHRWDKGGPKDSVIVVINFSIKTFKDYNIGVAEEGLWKIRFNSDWTGYDADFGNQFAYDTQTFSGVKDGEPFNVNVNLAAYSVLILSRD